MNALVALERRTCLVCGEPLGHWRDGQIHDHCEASLVELDHESLTAMVASVLLEQLALHEYGRAPAVDVVRVLLSRGVRATSQEVDEAVKKCRRRRIGMCIDGGGDTPGHHGGYRICRLRVWWRPKTRKHKRGGRRKRGQLRFDLEPQMRMEVEA